jgi:hypothetical protein
MNVYQTIDEVHPDQCFLCRPITNKFYNYLYFYKISYNLFSFTLNSIFIWIDLKHFTLKEQSDQFILSYTMEESFLEKLVQFERRLLERMSSILHKKIHSTIYEPKQLYYFKTKIESFRLYFRISGIWESETHIGLTSKVDLYPST